MASKVLLSPTENELSELMGSNAITSTLCEEKGADILIYSDKGLVGLQRKSIPNDFISSVIDGRFARLLPLLTTQCTFCRVVGEGSFKFWPDGTVHLGMMRNKKRIPSRFTRNHIHGMFNDLEFIYGIQVHFTDDAEDTVRYIESIQRFMSAKTHPGLFTRPKAKGTWIVPSTRDIHLWILQSFTGIGVQSATKIIDAFGRAPLQWTCTPEELARKAGISISKAADVVYCLDEKPMEREKKFGVFSSTRISTKTANVLTNTNTKPIKKISDLNYIQNMLEDC